MTSFPTGYGRAPTLLYRNINLANLDRTNYDIFKVSQQLSTGRQILRPSEDIVRAATISALDGRIERSDQILRNLEYASSSLDTVDQALGDAYDLTNEALSIAIAQIQSTSSTEERNGQAIVVDSLADSLYRIASRQSVVGYIFGGTAPGSPPVEDLTGAYRFVGERGGLITDLGTGLNIPVTLGANNAVGALSARVEGAVDLDPALEPNTRLSDLNGARNLGVTLGVIQASFNADDPFTIDLTGAVTVDDVLDTITAAIQQYESDSGNTVLGPGGVSISGESITLDIPSGSLVFSDLEGGVTAGDLGLDLATGFDSTNTAGNATDPRLTWTTQISSLAGLTSALGSIGISNNGKNFTIDLSSAQTLADLKSLIESGGSDVRVEINDGGDGINVVTQIAGTANRALSIYEVADGLGNTAEALGIRSMMSSTLLSDFNDGRGVSVVSGRTDLNGAVDPALNTDFTITLGDGFEIDIDLSPDDLTDVGNLLSVMEGQIDAALTAAGRPITDLDVSLSNAGNGIVLTQASTGNPITIQPKNNSPAAEQLGLMDTTVLGGGSVLFAQDRATVRVDNLFTALLDLSEALRNDDTSGIQFASDRLQDMVDRLTEQRALVGGYARQVDDEAAREEDRNVLDQTTRSSLRDVDFAEASSRFSLLQTQLQAGLTVTARGQSLSLLDFIS